MGSKPEEVKKHEEEKKMFEAAVKGLPVPPATKPGEEEKMGSAAAPAPTAEGSAWNAKAYHWEEKAVSEWAQKRLKEIIGGCTFEAEGAKGKIEEVKTLTGDVLHFFLCMWKRDAKTKLLKHRRQ
jgi:hypothetical protein